MGKFDNIILSYDLHLNKFKIEIEFSKKLTSEEHFYKSVSERKYNYKDFDFDEGGEMDAKNHFFMQLKELENEDENNNDYNYIEIAFEDLKNYVSMLEYLYQARDEYKSYQRKVLGLERMIYLLLAYGAADKIYELVMAYYGEMDENHEIASTDENWPFFLDLYDLYQKYGDYMLYEKMNVDEAVKFYELASLDWYDVKSNINNKIRHEKNLQIINNIDCLLWINEFIERPENSVKQWKELKLGDVDYKNIIISYLNGIKAKDENEIVKSASTFFHAIKRMTQADKTRNDLRMPFLIAHIIRNQSLEYVLNIIRKQVKSEEIDAKTQNNILECIRSTSNRRLAPMRTYIINAKINEQWLKICFDMLEMMEHIENIRRYLMVDFSEQPDLAYYTSLETFYYMLPFKASSDMVGKWSIMNIAYMNDPNEGKILLKRILAKEDLVDIEMNQRKNAKYPYVFIKCFSPQIDFLPMWEMYGDHAKGCCLVIDWRKIINDGKEIPLYNMCYLSKVGGTYRVDEKDNENLKNCSKVEEELEVLSYICSEMYSVDSNCISLICNILNEISYLFKDANYSYEKEVRICYQYQEVEPFFRHTPGEVGKLYVGTNFAIQIKEIILGPKFFNRSEVMPFLQEQVDLMCRRLYLNTPKITMSDIDYQ